MSNPGFIPCFRTLQHLSVPGSHTNEDGFGARRALAWIIDGATGVSGARLTPGQSDASWLAETIGAALTDEKADTIPDILSSVGELVTSAFLETAPDVATDVDAVAPSACLGLIRCREGAIEGTVDVEGAFLGDVVALVPSEAGVVRWTDERSKPFERLTLASLGRSDRSVGVMPHETRRQILENRTRMNHQDGYWVVHPLRPWAGREVRFDATIASGKPIVLATDGFMRLVDVFGDYTDDTLYAALSAGQALDLLQELRDREQRDDEASTFPRVKIHDDATVLVVAPQDHCRESRKSL